MLITASWKRVREEVQRGGSRGWKSTDSEGVRVRQFDNKKRTQTQIENNTSSFWFQFDSVSCQWSLARLLLSLVASHNVLTCFCCSFRLVCSV